MRSTAKYKRTNIGSNSMRFGSRLNLNLRKLSLRTKAAQAERKKALADVTFPVDRLSFDGE